MYRVVPETHPALRLGCKLDLKNQYLKTSPDYRNIHLAVNHSLLYRVQSRLERSAPLGAMEIVVVYGVLLSLLHLKVHKYGPFFL